MILPSFPRKPNFARRHRLLGRPYRLPQFTPFPPGLAWIWIILPSWIHPTIIHNFSQILKDSPHLRNLLFASSSPTLAVGAQYDDEGQWGPKPFEIPSIHCLQFEYHEAPSSNTFISPTCATLYCVSRAKITAPSCVAYWFLLKAGPNPSFLDLNAQDLRVALWWVIFQKLIYSSTGRKRSQNCRISPTDNETLTVVRISDS